MALGSCCQAVKWWTDRHYDFDNLPAISGDPSDSTNLVSIFINIDQDKSFKLYWLPRLRNA